MQGLISYCAWHAETNFLDPKRYVYMNKVLASTHQESGKVKTRAIPAGAGE